ncbi:MAG: NAD(P)H-dependent oxidoreductase [Propionibacterium sp.]|nr:NAD(P)H-dependent oxidoreductase [Propionibacterium sp.]
MSIKLIVTSTRPSRNGGDIAQHVAPLLAEGARRDVEILDLRDVALPFLYEPQQPSMGEYTQPSTKAWSETINAADAVVFLTPEYNGGFTAAAKNAIDTLFHEWNGKVAGIVGYGWGGAGRAVPQLAQIMTNVKMDVAENHVLMPFGEHMTDEGLAVDPLVAGHADELKALGTRLAQGIEAAREQAA